ncbi:cell envelope integrity protein TolA [Aurantiacibacter marinus]|nr:cell envelope integrity protein TolA [Aurantiacibacter marinus]
MARLSTEESVGIGVALVAHVALAAALAWHATRDAPPLVHPERITVSLATEVSLESTAPDPSAEPAASFAPVITDIPQAPQEPVTAPPVEPRPVPTTQPTTAPTSRPTPRPTTRATSRPTPAPTPTARASSRPAPTPTATRRAGGSRLGADFVEGMGATDGNTGTPAATFGTTERAALASAITRQLRPHWTAPSGVDVELLVSRVNWRLNRDGSLNGRPSCRNLSGVNDSNRPQAPLHCERAIRAVQLAAPFNLPEQFYSRWDDLEWDFDRRL